MEMGVSKNNVPIVSLDDCGSKLNLQLLSAEVKSRRWRQHNPTLGRGTHNKDEEWR